MLYSMSHYHFSFISFYSIFFLSLLKKKAKHNNLRNAIGNNIDGSFAKLVEHILQYGTRNFFFFFYFYVELTMSIYLQLFTILYVHFFLGLAIIFWWLKKKSSL